MNYQPYQPPRPQHTRPSHGLRNGIIISVASGAGLLVVLAVVGAALGGHPKAAGPGPAAPSSAPSVTRTAAAPALGRSGRDGAFAFTVRGMTCGAAAASAVSAGGYGETVPRGAVECIVTLRVTDDKGAAQTFWDASQYAYDARGRQLSADSTASLYLQGSQDGTQVNPGITITALVPFQIPRGDRITRLVLHDSAFSSGVTVRP